MYYVLCNMIIWYEISCFSICFLKTHSLSFKNKSIKIAQPSFILNLLKIPIAENCRYLGITIKKNPVIWTLKDK